MQFHVEYTVGMGFGADGRPHTLGVQSCIRDSLVVYASDNFPGATFIDAEGVWKEGSGRLYQETVLVIATDMYTNREEVLEHAKRMAQLASQSCVHVCLRDVYAVNVSPHGVITE